MGGAESENRPRLSLRGWLILWVVAAALGLVQPDPFKRLVLFCQVFLIGSVFVTFALRRWPVGCVGALVGQLALLNVAPHMHMPSFWNIPIGLWAGPLTLIVGLQLATGGVGLGALLLNLLGYTAVMVAASAAGARYQVVGLLLGWTCLLLSALAYGWVQKLGRESGRPYLADRCALALLIGGVAAEIFLPEVLYKLGLVKPPWE